MPTSSQPSTKVRPYEHVIRQKVKTDQTVQSKNNIELNKYLRGQQSLEESHKAKTVQFWKRHGLLREEISEERRQIHQMRVRINSAKSDSQHNKLHTENNIKKHNSSGSQMNKHRDQTHKDDKQHNKSCKVHFPDQEDSHRVEELSPDLLSRQQKILKIQREANKEVSDWIDRFKEQPLPGEVIEEEQDEFYY